MPGLHVIICLTDLAYLALFCLSAATCQSCGWSWDQGWPPIMDLRLEWQLTGEHRRFCDPELRAPGCQSMCHAASPWVQDGQCSVDGFGPHSWLPEFRCNANYWHSPSECKSNREIRRGKKWRSCLSWFSHTRERERETRALCLLLMSGRGYKRWEGGVWSLKECC